LRVDCPNRRRRGRSFETQDVTIEQLQRCLGQDDFVAADRRQFMHHDAPGAPAIVVVGIERQHLAAVAARLVDRAFQFGEAALHELRALGAGRHGDLDPDLELPAMLAVRRQHDSVAHLAGPAQPQAVVETSHRRALADIHLVILRRRDGVGVAAVAAQPRKRQRLVAMLVVDAEKPQWRRKQFIDTGLNVGAHMAGKRSRGRVSP
jgi:hypothetical protein